MSHITIDWHGDQFNVNLHSKEGVDAFLSIKGARIVNGAKGEFVSWPATKNQSTGKWWSHAYGSEKFNAVVLAKAMESKPAQGRRSAPVHDDDGPPF